MVSISHWGMFDIDQMWRDAYPIAYIGTPAIFQRLNWGPPLP